MANRIPNEIMAFQVEHVHVSQVSEEGGRPDSVALMLEVAADIPRLSFRFRSPESLNEFVQLLDRHRADVWPASKGVVRS